MTQNDAASVTPTEARHLAERLVSRTRGYDIKLREDDSRIAMIADALDAARLQGWNECREAAAGWHEAQAEEHASHQVSAERLGAHISAQAHETRRHQHMRDAALIRNLTPSTPES